LRGIVVLDLTIAVAEKLGVVIVDFAGAAISVDEEGRVALQVAIEIVHLFPIDVKLGDKPQVSVNALWC